MYPVAVCDMRTFYEDVEAWSTAVTASNTSQNQRKALDSDIEARLKTLEYDFPQDGEGNWASIVYFKIGCLVSAITYLHEQKIRHKDLKPSNILLSPGRLWLSDFGSATDFTLFTQSATDNGGGTPLYFAPE